MQGLCRGVSVVCAMAGAACAASVEEAYERLSFGLAEQAELLELVTDAGTAAKRLPELQRNVAALSALREQVSEAALWHYIDNTPGLKQSLTKQVQRICLQFARLEGAGFYGNAGLQALFASQLKAHGGAEP